MKIFSPQLGVERLVRVLAAFMASPQTQYLATVYLAALSTVFASYFWLPPEDFATYSFAQAVVNVAIVACALGVPTAASHSNIRFAHTTRSATYSVVIEHTFIQFLTAIALGISAATLLSINSRDLDQSQLIMIAGLISSSGLFPLWGVGSLGWYRDFAVLIASFKVAQLFCLFIFPPEAAWASRAFVLLQNHGFLA
jgi:O-antigen/teichoic acid export membrane protein